MGTELTFRLLVAALMTAAIAVSGYHRARADRDANDPVTVHAGATRLLIVLRLLGLPILLCLVAYVINPVWVVWARVSLPSWVRWVAVVVAFVALLLLVWVFRSLGQNITPSVETRRAHRLVRTGPYRWVRHPLYSIGLVFWISLAVISAVWVVVIAAIPALILLALRTPVEEAQLVERFGDEYRDYQRKTGRYVPRLWNR